MFNAFLNRYMQKVYWAPYQKEALPISPSNLNSAPSSLFTVLDESYSSVIETIRDWMKATPL